jgi:glycosyltransferase involved in cell wall biosynthesis
VVKNGETGYVVADGDVDALGRLIGELSQDRRRCTELGRRARTFAREHFVSWEDRTRMELEIIGRWVNPA